MTTKLVSWSTAIDRSVTNSCSAGQDLVDVSFIRGAKIDHVGNINTTAIGSYQRPTVRLPGSSGECDLAYLAKRFLVILAHGRRRSVEGK